MSLPALRSMRIIALPLVRPSPSSSSKNILTYYHFQIHDKGKGKGKDGGLSGIVKWATDKASDTWANFGKGKEGSWQVSFFINLGLVWPFGILSQ
jgi:hypothetical protein